MNQGYVAWGKFPRYKTESDRCQEQEMSLAGELACLRASNQDLETVIQAYRLALQSNEDEKRAQQQHQKEFHKRLNCENNYESNKLSSWKSWAYAKLKRTERSLDHAKNASKKIQSRLKKFNLLAQKPLPKRPRKHRENKEQTAAELRQKLKEDFAQFVTKIDSYNVDFAEFRADISEEVLVGFQMRPGKYGKLHGNAHAQISNSRELHRKVDRSSLMTDSLSRVSLDSLGLSHQGQRQDFREMGLKMKERRKHRSQLQAKTLRALRQLRKVFSASTKDDGETALRQAYIELYRNLLKDNAAAIKQQINWQKTLLSLLEAEETTASETIATIQAEIQYEAFRFQMMNAKESRRFRAKQAEFQRELAEVKSIFDRQRVRIKRIEAQIRKRERMSGK